MRRAFLPLMLFLPCALTAQVRERSALELNEVLTPWASSRNAAGLAFAPGAEYNTLSIGYEYRGGGLRPMQEGPNVSDLSFDTQGARHLGKVQLWGRFRYLNSSDRGSSFNTLLYDPFDERFLYTVADTVAGLWKRQSYELQFKAAVPLGEHFATGLHVEYTDRIAAAQIDPRAESYQRVVSVRPSAVWHPGRSTLGLSGLYSNTFERSTPSISNSQEIQKVYLLRGLGNWVGDQVGGSGLSTMYFRSDNWGGSLQYSWEGPWQFFGELSWGRHGATVTESATQPKPHGSTLQDELGLQLSALWRKGILLSRVEAGLSYRRTAGTEPTVTWNTASGSWEVQTELEQCLLGTLSAEFSYHLYKATGSLYKAHWYAAAGYESKDDSYATPQSLFSWSNMFLRAGAERRFVLGNGSLMLGAEVKGVKNLSALYSYSGHREGTAPVRDLYPHNLAVYSADRLQGQLAAEYAFPVSSVANLAFCLECTGTHAWTQSPGALERICALGAVKLYF